MIAFSLALPKFKVVAEAEADAFPSFLPKDVNRIKDPFARSLAMRIQRLPVPVRFSENPIMSSCVKPLMQNKANPVVLLHGFDSSCLEWRYTYPLLEEAGFETWAIDILGWGFSDLEKLPSCDVVSKREHFYQFWKSYIKRAMILVGPSLGSAVAIDFAINYPEAVEKLVLIDASVYAEGTGNLASLPRAVAYAGVYLLKSIPLRLYANYLSFTNISFSTSLDWTNVGRLHCLFPWWEDATIDFMISGGYNVASQIEKVEQKTLIIWGENDRIVSNKLAVRLHCELPDAILRQVPDCGHLPHVERPGSVVKFIDEFVQTDSKTCVSPPKIPVEIANWKKEQGRRYEILPFSCIGKCAFAVCVENNLNQTGSIFVSTSVNWISLRMKLPRFMYLIQEEQDSQSNPSLIMFCDVVNMITDW